MVMVVSTVLLCGSKTCQCLFCELQKCFFSSSGPDPNPSITPKERIHLLCERVGGSGRNWFFRSFHAPIHWCSGTPVSSLRTHGVAGEQFLRPWYVCAQACGRAHTSWRQGKNAHPLLSPRNKKRMRLRRATYAPWGIRTTRQRQWRLPATVSSRSWGCRNW